MSKTIYSPEMLDLVKSMRLLNISKKKDIIAKIKNKKTLTEKFILARQYLKPQSTDIESIIREDMKIKKPINQISGDGVKNGKNYEIKVSLHSKKSKLNLVQIRPDHCIDYYLIGYYNLLIKEVGQAYFFKIPSKDFYDLVIKYGCYAHGSKKVLGEITESNYKGRNCEYALRCNPNVKSPKNQIIWNELLKYEIEYKESKI